ncbi:hypothetical protein V8C42DRAFT_325713 [Trichoderma barbatum]
MLLHLALCDSRLFSQQDVRAELSIYTDIYAIYNPGIPLTALSSITPPFSYIVTTKPRRSCCPTNAMNTITTASTSSNLLTVPSSCASSATSPARPAFNSQRTQDRLREGEGLYAILFRTDTSNLQRGRKSVFKETGLDDYGSVSEVTDVVTSPVTSPAPSSSSQESSSPLPPFPPLKTHAVAAAAQGRPLESWYVWAALFACFGLR